MPRSAESILQSLREKFPKPTGREIFPAFDDPKEFIQGFTNTEEKCIAAMVLARTSHYIKLELHKEMEKE